MWVNMEINRSDNNMKEWSCLKCGKTVLRPTRPIECLFCTNPIMLRCKNEREKQLVKLISYIRYGIGGR